MTEIRKVGRQDINYGASNSTWASAGGTVLNYVPYPFAGASGDGSAIIDVRAYGASTSNAAASNKTAIDTAYAAVPAGGVLLIPELYDTTSLTFDRDNVEIRGIGRGSGFNCTSTSGYAVTFDNGVTRMTRPAIRNLKIVVPDSSTAGGIAFTSGADYPIVEYVHITHVDDTDGSSTGNAIYLDATGGLYYAFGSFINVTARHFDNGVVMGNTDNIYSASNNHVFNGCVFLGNSSKAGTYGLNLVKGNGNVFIGGCMTGFDVGYYLSESYGSNFTNLYLGNRVENCNTGYEKSATATTANFILWPLFDSVTTEYTHGGSSDPFLSQNKGTLHLDNIYAGTTGNSLLVLDQSGVAVMYITNTGCSFYPYVAGREVSFNGGILSGVSRILVTKDIELTAVDDTTTANNSIFVDEADGKLYFKDSGGTPQALY